MYHWTESTKGLPQATAWVASLGVEVPEAPPCATLMTTKTSNQVLNRQENGC